MRSNVSLKKMNLTDQVAEAKTLLEGTLISAYLNLNSADEANIHKAVAYRLARHVDELADDFLLLEKEGGYHGAPIILRAIIETIFSLGAIASDHTFAANKCIGEINEMIKKLESSDPELESALGKLRAKICNGYSLPPNPKNLKIWEIAKLAGMESLYQWQYYWLCKATHPTLGGTIEAESGGTAEMRGSTLAFALASASAFLVQVVETEAPQERIDKAAEILRFASASHANGEVRELNHDEVQYKADLTSYLRNQLKQED